MNRILCSFALTLMLVIGTAHGGVIEFTDKDEWINAVGAFTTIDFTGFPPGTFITDQYADLGVLFTDGSGAVGIADLLSLLTQWGADPGGPPDFDGNGSVGVSDLLALLANWGVCP